MSRNVRRLELAVKRLIRSSPNNRVHPEMREAMTQLTRAGRLAALAVLKLSRMLSVLPTWRVALNQAIPVPEKVALVSHFESHGRRWAAALLTESLAYGLDLDRQTHDEVATLASDAGEDSFQAGQRLVARLEACTRSSLLDLARLFRATGRLRVAHCLRTEARLRDLGLASVRTPDVTKALYDAGHLPIPMDVDHQSALRDIIEGRRVALVGGGVPDQNWTDDIESCDVVVRLKYCGRQSLLPGRQTGVRCDITVVNNLDPQLEELLRAEPRLLVLHRDESQQDRFIYMHRKVPVYTAAASIGLKALRAILEAGAGSVELFGFDFYTNHLGMSAHSLRTSADQNLRSLDREDFWFRCSAHAYHEPLSQRNAFRNIVDHYRVVPRGGLKNILRLSEEYFVDLTQSALEVCKSKSTYA